MKESKTVGVGFKRYCTYCGKKAEEHFEIDNREQFDYYYCTCNKALLEINLREQIEILTCKLPTENYKIRKDLEYKNELKALKRKYRRE